MNTDYEKNVANPRFARPAPLFLYLPDSHQTAAGGGSYRWAGGSALTMVWFLVFCGTTNQDWYKTAD
jgi:hypothetical protein